MKRVNYSLLIILLVLSNCIACIPALTENDPDASTPLLLSDPALLAAIKADNSTLRLFNVGDTTIKVKPDKEILPEKPAKKPDLSKLEKEKGKFRMVSVGGGLSAGFRDGGLYRAGQLGAFPALVARQMDVPFVQPLFSEAEGNGTGYKVIAGTQPLVSFKMVGNNLGVVQRGSETAYTDFVDKDKVDIDQVAFPDINAGLQFFRDPSLVNKSYKYIDRAVKAEVKTKYSKPWDWVNDQKADLFIFEFGLDQTYRCVSNGAGALASGGQLPYYFTYEYELVRSLAKKQIRGVLLNVPEVLDFPYFNQISSERVKNLGVRLFVEQYEYDPTLHRLIPTPTTEKLLKGELKGRVILTTNDVISGNDFNSELQAMSSKYYNTYYIGTAAKDTGWPVVDLYTLYKRIQAGGYVTDDGVAVNPAWPRGGNFFSADGAYPTAFGQAVIANEVIKTINRHYGLDIPLLQTRFFVGK